MTSLNISDVLVRHNLSDFKELFQNPAHSLRLKFAADKTENNPSRAGGRPSLPLAFDWPVSRAKIPLAFLCQIDLSQLKSFKNSYEPLPAKGVLSFFYDAFDGPWGNNIDDSQGFRVFYFEDQALLKKTDPPSNLPPTSVFAPCSVSLHEELSYPAITIEMATLSPGGYETFDAYLAAAEEIYGDSVIHRMFGFGQDIAGDFKLDCEIASTGIELEDDFDFSSPEGEKLALASEQWVLLLQLDSDEQAQMMWVDQGRLYFAIRAHDLAARRFHKVWMICETR